MTSIVLSVGCKKTKDEGLNSASSNMLASDTRIDFVTNTSKIKMVINKIITFLYDFISVFL